LTDPARRAGVVKKLDALCAEVAKPGACARAAEFIVNLTRTVRPVVGEPAG
jgi:hypothetical protein